MDTFTDFNKAVKEKNICRVIFNKAKNEFLKSAI